jgi:hypothetical protein
MARPLLKEGKTRYPLQPPVIPPALSADYSTTIVFSTGHWRAGALK